MDGTRALTPWSHYLIPIQPSCSGVFAVATEKMRQISRAIGFSTRTFLSGRMGLSTAASSMSEAQQTPEISPATSTLGIVETEVQTATGTVPVTNKLEIIDTQNGEKIPAFRLIDIHGKPIPNAHIPKLDKEVPILAHHIPITIPWTYLQPNTSPLLYSVLIFTSSTGSGTHVQKHGSSTDY